ncbi:MAG: glycosyltransferase involved in cell wall biosynthesis, partial [Paracoccaceae bacterium]
MQPETITGYSFQPSDLNIAARTPGISAYLRTRNGADFIEATIRSHIQFYDEIVVVYNQCEDNTADIVMRLAQEFGPKIRLFHYTDRVQPLGSKMHAKTPGNSPESMVNFSNFALVKTRHQSVIKLDDDHLAIPERVAEICKSFRMGTADKRALHCISGLNIARSIDGHLGIPAAEPVSGNGDIGYFQMAQDTFFFHDRRFERFGRGKLKRIFAGYLYWHMKFLKTGD